MIDKSEHGLAGHELKQKYDARQPGDRWSEHPEFSHEDWAQEASELNTLQGYWDWVFSRIDEHFCELEEEESETDYTEHRYGDHVDKAEIAKYGAEAAELLADLRKQVWDAESARDLAMEHAQTTDAQARKAR